MKNTKEALAALIRFSCGDPSLLVDTVPNHYKNINLHFVNENVSKFFCNSNQGPLFGFGTVPKLYHLGFLTLSSS